MRNKPGKPLHSRPVFDPAAQKNDQTPPTANSSQGPLPPPGTNCWIHPGHPTLPGIVLDWRQHTDGQWYALVSGWLPLSAVSRRPE